MNLGDSSHLIVVSNRLPITINKDDKGEYHFKMSSGGLVSALSGFKKSLSFTWIGWPGFFIPVKDRAHVDKRLKEEYSCQAVYLDDDVADRHYNGFSNSILWPLFHYHPGEMNFDEANWLAYRQANMQFAEAVMLQVKPGSMVWVQDYHLMLLPMMLRGLIDGPSKAGDLTKRELPKVTEDLEESEVLPADTKGIPGIKIGFFLHTPFPSSEIYRSVATHINFATHLTSYLESCLFVVRSSSAFSTAISLASTRMIMLATSFPLVPVFWVCPPCLTVSNSKAV